MQDAGTEAQTIVHSLLVPQPMSYVLSSDDAALPPGEFGWARFAERLGVEPVPAPGSHEGLFTQPQGVAHALQHAPTSPGP